MTLKIELHNDALRIPSSLKDNGPRMLTPSEIDWLRQNLKASLKNKGQPR